jgi:prophage antirepressor-like protein
MTSEASERLWRSSLRSRSPRSRATISTSDGRYEVTVTGHQLRVVTIDGNPWFVAADVCKVLGLENATKALHALGSDEKTLTKIQGFRGPAANLISESGLYMLVMRAHRSNPEAREFQDWVTREVLPAIRKDGAYIQGEEKIRTGEMSDLEFFARALQAANRVMDDMKIRFPYT